MMRESSARWLLLVGALAIGCLVSVTSGDDPSTAAGEASSDAGVSAPVAEATDAPPDAAGGESSDSSDDSTPEPDGDDAEGDDATTPEAGGDAADVHTSLAAVEDAAGGATTPEAPPGDDGASSAGVVVDAETTPQVDGVVGGDDAAAATTAAAATEGGGDDAAVAETSSEPETGDSTTAAATVVDAGADDARSTAEDLAASTDGQSTTSAADDKGLGPPGDGADQTTSGVEQSTSDAGNVDETTVAVEGADGSAAASTEGPRTSLETEAPTSAGLESSTAGVPAKPEPEAKKAVKMEKKIENNTVTMRFPEGTKMGEELYGKLRPSLLKQLNKRANKKKRLRQRTTTAAAAADVAEDRLTTDAEPASTPAAPETVPAKEFTEAETEVATETRTTLDQAPIDADAAAAGQTTSVGEGDALTSPVGDASTAADHSDAAGGDDALSTAAPAPIVERPAESSTALPEVVDASTASEPGAVEDSSTASAEGGITEGGGGDSGPETTGAPDTAESVAPSESASRGGASEDDVVDRTTAAAAAAPAEPEVATTGEGSVEASTRDGGSVADDAGAAETTALPPPGTADDSGDSSEHSTAVPARFRRDAGDDEDYEDDGEDGPYTDDDIILIENPDGRSVSIAVANKEGPDGELISAEELAAIIEESKDQIMKDIGVESLEVVAEAPVMAEDTEEDTTVVPVARPTIWERHFGLFLTIIILLAICIVIVIICCICIYCRKREDSEKTPMAMEEGHKQPLVSVSSPMTDDDIVRDEAPMVERENPALTQNGGGQHINKLDDDGWVIPLEELNDVEHVQPDVENTRL